MLDEEKDEEEILDEDLNKRENFKSAVTLFVIMTIIVVTGIAISLSMNCDDCDFGFGFGGDGDCDDCNDYDDDYYYSESVIVTNYKQFLEILNERDN